MTVSTSAASSAGGGGAAAAAGGGGRRSPLAPPLVARLPATADHDAANTNTSSTSNHPSPYFSSWYRMTPGAASGNPGASNATTPTMQTTAAATAAAASMFRFSPRQSWTGLGGGGGPGGGGGGGFGANPPPLQSPYASSATATLPRSHAPLADPAPDAAASAVVVDGVPVDELRKLASDPNNLSNLFFAQLLHGKTRSKSDALLLARLYLLNGQSGACWRVLDESLLLAPVGGAGPGAGPALLSWPALDVAVAALASTEDWTMLQQFLHEVLAEHGGAGNSWDGSAAGAGAPADVEARIVEQLLVAESDDTLDDDDDDRVLASRVWYWRGRAHWEVGDPVVAARYWRTSLELDARNQAAWNAILSLHLMTPQQAYELIMQLNFGTTGGWLRALYLAQIPVTQQAKDASGATTKSRDSLISIRPPHEAQSDDPSLDFGDASSIQLNSPMMTTSFFLNDENNATSSKAVATAGGPPQRAARGPGAAAQSQSHPLPPCHVKVQEAFADLTNRYKLGDSPLVLALAARRAYSCYDWKTCLSLCEQLAAIGSIAPTASTSGLALSHASSATASADAAYCYVAVLALLGRHRSLFALAHEWVSAAPKSPQSWFAVGAYYYATGRYHVAQRHFCRATRLDPHCSPAWMAFGCSFAVVDESDQALASFRAAQRLAPGDSLPLLYMGIEYVRTNHLTLAHHFLRAARAQAQDDPLCLHESGVLELQKGNLESAIQWFSRALRVLSKSSSAAATTTSGLDIVSIEAAVLEVSDPYWEPTVFNLGHALRKSRQFDLARRCFEQCVALSPSASAYAALAFTTHLAGDADAAISLYHQALAVKPDDPFASDMLNRALRDSMLHGIDNLLSTTAVPVPAPVASMRPGGKMRQSSLLVGRADGKLGEDSLFSNDGVTMDQSEEMDSDVDMSG
jgi:tetratricopeptide (TPR) repeat protein